MREYETEPFVVWLIKAPFRLAGALAGALFWKLAGFVPGLQFEMEKMRSEREHLEAEIEEVIIANEELHRRLKKLQKEAE